MPSLFTFNLPNDPIRELMGVSVPQARIRVFSREADGVVVGSAMGLYYYLRVMVTLFLIEPGMRRQEPPRGWEHQAGGVVVLGAMALMLLLGVYPQPLMNLIQWAVMP